MSFLGKRERGKIRQALQPNKLDLAHRLSNPFQKSYIEQLRARLVTYPDFIFLGSPPVLLVDRGAVTSKIVVHHNEFDGYSTD